MKIIFPTVRRNTDSAVDYTNNHLVIHFCVIHYVPFRPQAKKINIMKM